MAGSGDSKSNFGIDAPVVLCFQNNLNLSELLFIFEV